MNMLQRRVKGRKEGGKAQRKVTQACVLNLGRIGWEGWKGDTFCLWKIGEGLWMDRGVQMYWIVCTFGEKTQTGKLLRSAQSKEGPGTDILFLGHRCFLRRTFCFFSK